MNEILATLYYCFYESAPQHAEYFESDLFFCFTKVMSDMRDGFIRTLDNEETGINGKIAKFTTIFAQIDLKLITHLEDNNVQPNFYALRQLMLWFAQDFELLNVIRIWDKLLSDPVRWNFGFYFAIALVQLKRDELLKGDFSDIMELLQRKRSLEVDEDETAFIDKVMAQAKKICLKHTRKYDYFIEKRAEYAN